MDGKFSGRGLACLFSASFGGVTGGRDFTMDFAFLFLFLWERDTMASLVVHLLRVVP